MLSHLEILTYRFLRKQSKPHVLVFLKIFLSPGENWTLTLHASLSITLLSVKKTIVRSYAVLFSSDPGMSRETETVKVQYHTWAGCRRGFFLFLYKERKPNIENRLWGRKGAHPTNSSLILGLPCTGTEKLSSYEVHSSVAKVYVHVSM